MCLGHVERVAVRGQPVCFRPASCHAFCLEKSNLTYQFLSCPPVPGYSTSQQRSRVRQAIERLRAHPDLVLVSLRRHGLSPAEAWGTPAGAAVSSNICIKWVTHLSGGCLRKGRLPVHSLWLPHIRWTCRRSLPMVNSTWPSVNWYGAYRQVLP